jgi:hypothetical protein
MLELSSLIKWVIEHSSLLVINVLFVAAVVFLLERRVKRLAERVQALKKAAGEFEDELEREAIAPTNAPIASVPVRNNWEDIRAHWRVVRDRLEELITEVDGRRQRTYDRTSRYTYKYIIDMLREDEKVDATTATFLHSMNEMFLGLRRNARNTSTEAANTFIERFDRIAGALKIERPARAPLPEPVVAAE